MLQSETIKEEIEIQYSEDEEEASDKEERRDGITSLDIVSSIQDNESETIETGRTTQDETEAGFTDDLETPQSVQAVNKPRISVGEDRTLQAVLEDRRRSLEMSKNAFENPPTELEDKNDKKPEMCEEIQAAKNPLKWVSAMSFFYEKSKESIQPWKSRSSTFEPVKEIAYRENAYDDFLEVATTPPQIAASSYKRIKSVKKSGKKEKTSKSGDVLKSFKKASKRGDQAATSETKGFRVRHRNAKVSMHLNRELRQKQQMLGCLGDDIALQEVYTDKDRAAAVTLGDQDIKTSLKVKQKNERRVVYTDDMDSSIFLAEAQKNLLVGNLETAYNCAVKAVEGGGPDPQNILMRARCSLATGRLREAYMDSQDALNSDPSLTKALLVQAESLYSMGEFERSLVLFHRGNKTRADLEAFRKGIQKCREAILNAIGVGKFPEAPHSMEFSTLSKTVYVVTSSVNETLRSKFGVGTDKKSDKKMSRPLTVKNLKSDKPSPVNPLMTEIKTSKLASKRLLGGLSSDKEFLKNLIEREKQTSEKYTFSSHDISSSRRKSVAKARDRRFCLEKNILNEAKEALTSIQYLEAFLWQQNPGGLRIQNKSNKKRKAKTDKSKKSKAEKEKESTELNSNENQIVEIFGNKIIKNLENKSKVKIKVKSRV